MKIFKHIKTGKLYTIHTLTGIKDPEKCLDGVQHTAIPYYHDDGVLINVDIKNFVPVQPDEKNR